MIIIYHDSFSPVQHIFKTHGTNVPFIGDSLLNYSLFLFYGISQLLNQKVKIYLPEMWQELVDESIVSSCHFYSSVFEIEELKERTFVVMTDVFSLPIGGFADLGFLQNQPGILFDVNGMKVGFLSIEDFKQGRVEEQELFDVIRLDQSNFLFTSRLVLERTKMKDGVSLRGENHTYGNPTIKTENIVNSRIYGPCYIDEESTIKDSTILPGTIILKSNIIGSEILGSFLHDTYVKDTKLDEILSSGAIISNVELSNSILPSTARIRGVKKEAIKI